MSIAQSNVNVRFLDIETSLARKLGRVKFEQIFDSTTIHKAEKTLNQHQSAFSKEVNESFNSLFAEFIILQNSNITKTEYLKFAETAFSIKSRAGIGGNDIISQIANSLYQYAEKAANICPANGYLVIKLHIDAMKEVFDNKFPKNNKYAAEKLLNGLASIAIKFAS